MAALRRIDSFVVSSKFHYLSTARMITSVAFPWRETGIGFITTYSLSRGYAAAVCLQASYDIVR
jgi:hypothetical protein